MGDTLTVESVNLFAEYQRVMLLLEKVTEERDGLKALNLRLVAELNRTLAAQEKFLETHKPQIE